VTVTLETLLPKTYCWF